MTRIFKLSENIYQAVDSVLRHGYAALEGTESSAVPYAKKVLNALSVYPEVSAITSFRLTAKQGYLYFVYDTNKLKHEKVISLIDAVDLRS
ncbi:hypothetical protein GNF76_15585 [Pseudomonas sp. CCM 7893]|uniref:Uncharacterized protein n=1 Tax=Pseudomonas spelaei TaxID=1055469 RepID=A0A6I3W6A5_9PSED|nr:hypothetical protein [Pseudomonas spelaei]MUF05775.1 hypothetical protein [Pseudomonas spelaei]QLG93851.1 hypothetical protein HZF02_18690 [Pseudomonas yamanorum]